MTSLKLNQRKVALNEQKIHGNTRTNTEKEPNIKKCFFIKSWIVHLNEGTH